MTLTLIISLLLPTAFADSVQVLYGSNDVDRLTTLCDGVAGSQHERLLCRYRLYPLTEDEHYLKELPEALPDDASAGEVALLAGLWGYRAARGSMLQTIRAGRRAADLLDRARSLDPDDPYLLLIEGQSLLFRPPPFGGNDAAALSHFHQLREQLDDKAVPGVSTVEVDVWIWYAMKETGDDGASSFRDDLFRRDPPPLYREMLTSMT